MNARIPPYPHPARVTGIVGEVIEVTHYVAAACGASPASACVIVESAEDRELISVHLASADARWLGAMIIAAADAADRDAATKRGRSAAVAEIERGMQRAVEAASNLPPGSGA